jgi:mono/diheme cytochrome c family protein
VGVVLKPAVIASLSTVPPSLGRSLKQLLRRPVAIGAFCLMLLGFGVPSYAQTTPVKKPDAAAGAKGPAKAAAASPAQVAAGKKLFLNMYMCNLCHGDNGEGTDQAPKLAGIGAKMKQDEIAAFLAKPSARALDAGMPNVDTTNPDSKALIAFVLSLKP